MASTYQDKELQQNSAGTSNLSQSIGKTVSGNTAASSVTASGNAALPSGGNYAQQVSSLMKNNPLQYKQGDNVTSAKSYLDQVIANKPGSFQSKYTGQVQDLYNKIMNRQAFNYDVNGDAMYQMYANRYKQAGLRNMRDAMGQASAQTGGFGSSYAQTAGQAAYNEQLGALANMTPQLQANALNRYNDETANLNNLYNTANQAEQTDYGRYQDRYNMWQNEREYAANQYDQAYSNDYNQWQNNVNNAMNIYNMQREDQQIADQWAREDRLRNEQWAREDQQIAAQNARQDAQIAAQWNREDMLNNAQWGREDAQNAMQQAQKQAQMYINAGIMPSSDLLAQTGWDKKSVKALVKKKK